MESMISHRNAMALSGYISREYLRLASLCSTNRQHCQAETTAIQMQWFTAQLPSLMCREWVWQSTKLMQLQGFADFNKLLWGAQESIKHFYIQ